ncbi:cystatin-F isoform X2 [Thalassophryne amazonica]|uniref:cystatin-F isoform X2 n=1 Tax=Thalassophryne amazonica TaxID=390379 RepID=UPI0014719BC2|nr:cystatin-F isoform X2 [Thalassophryne amazonica]
MVLLHISLLLLLGMAAGRNNLGAPQDISKNNPHLLKALNVATEFFNNMSNDAFLFKTSNIQKAQQQIVRGITYLVDLGFSRTVCHKRDKKDLANCDFQPKGRLHQVCNTFPPKTLGL